MDAGCPLVCNSYHSLSYTSADLFSKRYSKCWPVYPFAFMLLYVYNVVLNGDVIVYFARYRIKMFYNLKMIAIIAILSSTGRIKFSPPISRK